MKKAIRITGVLLMAIVMFLNTSTMNSSNGDLDLTSLLNITDANAECEITATYLGQTIVLFKCDDTPNETCSLELDDVTVTCSGKQTWKHKKVGGTDK